MKPNWKRLWCMLCNFKSAVFVMMQLFAEAQEYEEECKDGQVARVRHVIEFKRREDGIFRCNFIGVYYQTQPNMRWWITRRYKANEAGDKLLLY